MDAPLHNLQAPTPPVATRYGFGAVAAFAFIGVFLLGLYLGGLQAAPAVANPPGEGQVVGKDEPVPGYLSKDVDFAQFWEVWQTVKSRYAHQPVSDLKLFYGAVEGMVGSLEDPYSVFLDPEYAEQFSDELEGRFEGIGAEIGIKEDQLVVIAPLAGTPAEKAGLEAGDMLVAINGEDTSGLSVDEAVKRIRGPKDTVVVLTTFRKGWQKPKDVSITRDTIRVDSVTWKKEARDGKTFGVITITHFNDSTTSLFNDAVRQALADGVSGIVLDLRNDPGGYLSAAVDVAGAWVGPKTIVQEKFSDGTIEAYDAKGSARLAGMPTVVLVNGGSASASEIVTGALQDYGAATVVGETTYGKGSVQDLIDLGGGSQLKLTIALWLTPKGRSIDKQGIEPDVKVERTEADFAADRDPQLDRAFEILAKPAGL